jgi:hypothetical protein
MHALLAGGEIGLSLLPVRAVYRKPPHVLVLAALLACDYLRVTRPFGWTQRLPVHTLL